jgi:hypothetical protein
MEIKGGGYIQGQTFRTIFLLVTINPNQRLTLHKKTALQTNDNKLEPRPGIIPDILGHLGDVGVVERGINLIENEEGGGMVRVDGEEKGECGDGFFATGELVHVTESFHGGHGVVLDAVEVGFL